MNGPRKHQALLDMSRRDLARWARVNAERDQLVTAAAASGLSRREIAAITGIARTTIDRILAPASSATSPPTPASSTPAEHIAERTTGAPTTCRHCGQTVRWDHASGSLEHVQDVVDPEPRDVVVIACGADKLDHPAPAAELYTGSYFRACLATALAIADPGDVRILSAKHGLLKLDELVAPYDMTIGDPGAVDSLRVMIQAKAQGIYDRPVRALCPVAYADLLRAAGLRVVDAPLAGLGIGQQRHALAELRR